MDRTPETLVRQATDFLIIIGNAQALSVILRTDPLFEKFMADECGLDVEKVKDFSSKLNWLDLGIKDQDGIVTVDNCRKFLEGEFSKRDT